MVSSRISCRTFSTYGVNSVSRVLDDKRRKKGNAYLCVQLTRGVVLSHAVREISANPAQYSYPDQMIRPRISARRGTDLCTPPSFS